MRRGIALDADVGEFDAMRIGRLTLMIAQDRKIQVVVLGEVRFGESAVYGHTRHLCIHAVEI